jgi:hypothetical protein
MILIQSVDSDEQLTADHEEQARLGTFSSC